MLRAEQSRAEQSRAELGRNLKIASCQVPEVILCHF